jgi:hypothetical protein
MVAKIAVVVDSFRYLLATTRKGRMKEKEESRGFYIFCCLWAVI